MTYNPRLAKYHAKNQGQRSNGSNRRAPTDKRTEHTDATKRVISPATRSIIALETDRQNALSNLVAAGYGTTTPKTAGGFAFTVAFALVGIPLFLVLLASVGVRQRGAVDRLLSRCLPTLVAAAAGAGDGQQTPSARWVIYQVIRFLVNVAVCGALFCLVPAAVFQLVERWSYAEALYYVCITITTIGFGDYVAGMLLFPLYIYQCRSPNPLPLGLALW